MTMKGISMLKTILILLVLVGAVLGPGYWIHGKFFTGQSVQVMTFTAGEAGRWTSGEFEVTTDMAPLGLILTAAGNFKPNTTEDQVPKDPYGATLYYQDAPLHSIVFSLSPGAVTNSNPVFKEHLFYMKHLQAGKYRLELEPKVTPRMTLSDLKLDVKAGIQEPDGALAAAGVSMLIVGGVLLFLL